MKFEIKKANPKVLEYNAGDILSLGNPYRETHYLLITGKSGEVGAINLLTNELAYFYSQAHNFDTLVTDILKEGDWDEWSLVKSDDVTVKLDYKLGAIEQRNNSGLF